MNVWPGRSRSGTFTVHATTRPSRRRGDNTAGIDFADPRGVPSRRTECHASIENSTGISFFRNRMLTTSPGRDRIAFGNVRLFVPSLMTHSSTLTRRAQDMLMMRPF